MVRFSSGTTWLLLVRARPHSWAASLSRDCSFPRRRLARQLSSRAGLHCDLQPNPQSSIWLRNGLLYGTTTPGKPRTLLTVLVLPACVRKEDPRGRRYRGGPPLRHSGCAVRFIAQKSANVDRLRANGYARSIRTLVEAFGSLGKARGTADGLEGAVPPLRHLRDTAPLVLIP